MGNLSPTVEGIITTGIYCRSGCSGRPAAKNIRPYASPVAAEAAGFRPCLLCRPDREPDELSVGHPPAIERAVALIADGYLDRHREDELAATVGFSARQLRRLFIEHVGASPDMVARSRRAHFARRLLDETDLTITDIAFAAGFSSVRQMNRVMKEIFRFTPSELRSKRREADRLVTDGGLALRIPLSGPYDGGQQLAYFAGRCIPGVESVSEGRYRRTIRSCGHPGMVELTPRDDHIELVAHLPTYASLIDVVGHARRFLGLSTSMDAARKALGCDELLGPIVRAIPGVRVPGAWDRFETAIRIVLGQQVSVAGASTMTGRLAATCGEPVEGLPGGLAFLFPPANVVAEADLTTIGLTSARQRTIRALATEVAGGSFDLVGTGDVATDVARYCELPGIGPWTAHLIALRCGGHPDAFPAGDLGLRKSVTSLLGTEATISAPDLQALATRWTPHRSAAAIWLWSS